MSTYRYYGLDNNRNEIASGTIDAASKDEAIKAAEAALSERDIECADIDVIEA